MTIRIFACIHGANGNTIAAMKHFLLLLLVMASCGTIRPVVAQNPPGLTVRDGVLYRAGQPYRGIGANYFSLFARLLKNPADTSTLSNLTALAHAGIPFVRFMGCGFWPIDQQLYATNRTAYFERLDRVVRCAETNGIGLIPSLFWNTATVSDVVGEHLAELGNPESKSIALIRQYTAELVLRYQDSPAIWGWEFGNEYNLACDLPNAAQHRPPVVLALGTAAHRTERDELQFVLIRTAFLAFAETVRRFDKTRPIFSGNAIPRPSAWHNVREHNWRADSAAEFTEILLRDNPDPLNTLTIHLYPQSQNQYPGGAHSLDTAVALAAQIAARAHKPLFIGEFGAEGHGDSRDRQPAVFEETLDAIVAHHVPLAAFWVFDLPSQNADWNVNFHNDRAWMLDRVIRANSRIR